VSARGGDLLVVCCRRRRREVAGGEAAPPPQAVQQAGREEHRGASSLIFFSPRSCVKRVCFAAALGRFELLAWGKIFFFPSGDFPSQTSVFLAAFGSI